MMIRVTMVMMKMLKVVMMMMMMMMMLLLNDDRYIGFMLFLQEAFVPCRPHETTKC